MSSSLTPQDLDALQYIPAIQPPAGVIPNFAQPENRNQPFFIVTSLLLGFMAIFLINRGYTKTFIARKYSWDDLTIILAVIGSVAYYVACVWGAQKGKIGSHLWDISVLEVSSSNLIVPSYLISILTPPTMLCTKVTFFIMYLSIFRPMRWMRICAYIGAVLTSSFYMGMFLAQLILQTPGPGETLFSRIQIRSVATRSLALSVPQSAVGLIIDLYILVLPIIAVTRVQLPRRRKVGISLIFMTGIMACLSSLLSIYYRHLLNLTPDITWALMPVNAATLAEMFVGVICACMPSAAQLCRHHLHHYESIKTRICSRIHSLRSGDKHTTGPSTSDLENNHRGTSTEKPFWDLRSYKLAKHYDLIQTKGIRTIIQGGQQDDSENDGIRLTYEIRTNT